MGVTRFSSQVDVGSSGGQDVDKLATSFEKLAGAIEGATAKGDKLAQHPGFDDFASKVKRGIEDPLGAAGDAVESLLKGMGPLGAGMAAGVGIFTAAGVAGFEAAKSLGEMGTQITNVALRTGLTIKEVSQFGYAAQVAGTDVSIFERMMRGLSETADDTSVKGGKARAALKGIGVDLRDSNGEIKPTAQLLIQISEGLAGMTDTLERNNVAKAIFNRLGIEAIPVMMGLAENTAHAKQAGYGPSDAEVKQMEGYHKEIIGLEKDWEKLSLQMKIPLAGTFIYTVKALGQTWDFASAPSALMMQLLFGSKATATDLEMRETQGFGFGASESRSGHAAVAAMIHRNDDEVAAALLGTTEEQLSKAKTTLTELRGGLKTGVLPGVNTEAYADIKAQESVVKNLEARIKATKDLATEEKAREAFLKSLTTQEQSAHDATLDPSARILAKMDEQIAAAEKLKFTAEQMLAVRLRESEIADVELQTLAKKAAIEFDAYDRTREEAAAKARDKALIIVPAQAGLAETSAGFSADAQIASIEASTERADVMRRSSRVGRMADLAGGGGPLDEVRAINVGYQQRLVLAGKLYDFEMTGAEAKAKLDGDVNAQRVAEAHAMADLQKEMRDADLEHELKIAELQRKRLDELRNGAGAFFDALLQGGKGVEAFLKNLGMGWARTIFQNMAVELLKGQSSGHLTLPGEGTADHPTFLGKALAGTPLGIDPLKGMDPLKLATDLNTKATDANTAALLAWVQALLASGGGGSLGRLPGIFTSGGQIPNVSSSISYGAGGGYSETDTPTDGLPTDGSPGDWAGEYSGAAAGKYDSVIGGVGISKVPGGSSAGRFGMYGAAILAGGFGAYSGFKAGGAQGALTGVGSITGAAAVLDPEPISKAILMGMAMGSGLVSMLLGDPKQNRDLAEAKTLGEARYTAPTAANYTLDRYGRSYDSDVSGAIRPIVIQVPITVNAMDAKSFQDQAHQIAAAVTTVLESKASPRLSMALRNVAFQK